MSRYGQWDLSLSVDDEDFKCEAVDSSYSTRAGAAKIYAINGLPKKFEDNLVRAAQVSDVPHTWRVKECRSEAEVTAEILQLGREALARDRKVMNAHVIAYIGDLDGDGKKLEFLAAGAVRDKLTSSYQNAEYPVVSRAIVAPRWRGKHLGTLIVEHRMKILLNNFYGVRPKAIHFGTESKKILHAIKTVERDENMKFVYIGDEEYTASDGTHTVHDFLGFTPWFKEFLKEKCETIGARAADFQAKLLRFMEYGVSEVLGNDLFQSFSKLESVAGSEQRDAVDALQEVFLIRDKIGASDPKQP